MIKSPLLLICLFSIWSTLIVTNNCENFKAIYVNPLRSSSIIYGTFSSSPESTDNLTQSVVDCSFVNHPKIIEEILSSDENVKNSIQVIKNIDVFESLAEICSPKQLTTNNQSPLAAKSRKWRFFGISSDILIAPGTKWCGPGNRSAHYDDLGTSAETDKCCREHDHCPLSVHAYTSKFNLTNNSGYTISHCDCDEQMRSCLKNAAKTDVAASMIGIMFYNLLKFKCIREVTRPKVECLEYEGLNDTGPCVRTAYFDEEETVWDFLDGGSF